jgi:multidrug efflux system outer membrane protein
MVLLAGLLGARCMVGPDYVRPDVEKPPTFKSEGPGQPPLPIAPEWWRLYKDEELDRLVAAALESNQVLRQASGRLSEARAVARIAASYLLPTVSLDPVFTRAKYSANRINTSTGQLVQRGASVSDWLVPFDLSYEVDVWGRIRRSMESAAAQAAASACDLALVRLTVETDVALYYFNIRSLDTQGRILRETVEAYTDQLRLVTAQVGNGLASPLVAYQARAQLEAALAQKRDTARARADLEHALAILCGRPASSFALSESPVEAGPPPAVPPGLPAQLLSRRPDVAEAEENMRAANAQIGVAVADFYPRFTIIGQAGVESADYSNVLNWQSRLAAIGPGFSLPVFTGGRIRANVDAANARYSQAVAAYTNQVLIAYGDVEDSLTDLRAFSDEAAHLREAVAASRNYLRAAQVQYRQGLVDYLTVTDAEAKLLANRLSLAGTAYLQMAASVRLIKALGGGW